MSNLNLENSNDGTQSPSLEANQADCPDCGPSYSMPDQFVYAIGTLDVQFPSLGVEREFTHRERQTASSNNGVETRGERIHRVLSQNHYLARNVCYTLSVGSVPAYVIAPVSASVGTDLVETISTIGQPTTRSVVIGQRVGNSAPETCGGLLLPVLACDLVYTFSLEDWCDGLAATAKEALEACKVKKGDFQTIATEVFNRVTSSMENIGGLDTHRALNYVAVQHPGFFIAAAERANTHVLDRIETRPVQARDARSHVAVIATFIQSRTGVPERLFCVIDVSERWPFVAATEEVGVGPLSMIPFIENSVLGMTI